VVCSRGGGGEGGEEGRREGGKEGRREGGKEGRRRATGFRVGLRESPVRDVGCLDLLADELESKGNAERDR
jgi:hypothetical protein